MRAGLRFTALAVAAFTSACDAPTPPATARQVMSRDELIGGPTALGEVGDFLLENDKIRVVIQGPGFSRGFGVYGGSLIDADLQRPTATGDAHGGRGRDLFGELFPIFFLQALVPKSVSVANDGLDGDPAKIRVSGTGGDFFTMTRTLNQVINNSHELPDAGIVGLLDTARPDGEAKLAYDLTYELPAGERYIKLTSIMRNISGGDLKMPEPTIGSLLTGFLGLSGGFQAPMGAVVLFGAGNKVFIPGRGYGVRFALEDAYTVGAEKGLGFPALPGLITNGLVTTSKTGVSYGFFALPDPQTPSYVASQLDADGKNRYAEAYGVEVGSDSMLIPFLASAFTGVFYGQAPSHLAPDQRFGQTTYFVVGDGDVASVMNTVYKLRGLDTETLAGEVIDETTAAPVEWASVLVYAGGQPVNHLFTDAQGRFKGQLPQGAYELRVESDPMLSEPVPITVGGDGAYARLTLPSPARIAVTVVDAQGRPLPAKVSVVGEYDAKFSGQELREFLFDVTAGQRWRHTDLEADQALEAGTRQYLEAFDFAELDGKVVLDVPPAAHYRVVVSRGPEYTIHRATLRPTVGEPAQLLAVLERVVDTKGYIAADFHIHADPSLDSDVGLHERVVSGLASGLELMTATDHNFITDYAPTIAKMGAEDWLSSLVGIELTTLEAGHFNGFPVKREAAEITKGSFEWANHPPTEVFKRLRAQGALGSEDFILQVNHARDTVLGYFEQFDLDPVSARPVPLPPASAFDFGNFVHPSGPAFLGPAGENLFSFDFDAMELFNGGIVGQLHHATLPARLEGLNIPEESRALLPTEPGTILCEDGDVAFPGVVDDWFNLLNLGHRYVGTGNSDSHETEDIGVPRTYLRMGTDDPAAVTPQGVVKAFREHAALVTNGPFVELFVDGKPIGSDVKTAAATVEVRVNIQAAPWVDVVRGTLYANGRVAQRFPITMTPSGGATRFSQTFAVDVPRDTWFVVEVEGDRNLFPVAPPLDIAPVALDDALASVGAALGFGASTLGDLEPGPLQVWRPFAITNPIWVDVGTAGFDAPGLVPRCCKGLALVEVESTDACWLAKQPTMASTFRRVLKPSFGIPRVRRDTTDVRVIFDHFRHGH